MNFLCCALPIDIIKSVIIRKGGIISVIPKSDSGYNLLQTLAHTNVNIVDNKCFR